MVVTNEDGQGRQAYKNGDNPFTTTSTNEEEGELVIEIDNEEVLNTAIKSIIGGVATGLVVNRFLEK